MRISLRVNGVECRGRLLGGRVASLRAAREARLPGLEERVRAGRVRLVLGAARRDARLLVPRARGAGRRARRHDDRGAGRRRGAPSGAGGVRRGGRRAVRVLHAGARRRRRRPAPPDARSDRRRDPRGALRATSAAARATRRSSTPCAWRQRTAGDESVQNRDEGHLAPGLRRATIPAGGGWSRSPPRVGVRALSAVAGRVRARHDGRRSRRAAQGRADRGEPAPGGRRSEGQGRVRLLERPERARDALGPHRSQPARARADPRDRHLRPRSGCRASTPCSPTTTCRARSATASSSATSPCSRSTASATTASRSRSSPPSTRSRHAAPPRRSASSTSRSSRSPTWSARRSRRSSTPTGRRGPRLPRRPAAERRPHDRHPPRRPGRSRRRLRRGHLRDRASRTRPSSAPSRASRSPTARAASTSTSRRSGCTSTAPRSRRASGSPPERVRVHLAGVGGAFGGREDVSMQIHAALLALHTNRAVKIVYNREESFTGHVHRHPVAHLGAAHRRREDGTLVSVEMRILLDGGAYASSSTAVCANAAAFAVGPYNVPNALLEATVVYTNNPPCGAMRGFGAVQTCFAGEAQMDKLADALGIDPVELRLLNALGPGDTLPTGQRIEGSLPTAEVIRAAAALEPPRARGASARPASAARRRREHHAAARASAAASASRSASRTSASPRASTTTAPRASGSSPTAPPRCTARPPRSGRASRT